MTSRRVLRLSEHAAYGRIEAARAARRFPAILELLCDGSVNLTTVSLVASHLTPENHREVLAAATHKSKREVEELVARLRPRPDTAALVRKLPVPKTSTGSVAMTIATAAASAPLPLKSDPPSEPATPAPRATIAPLAPERYKVQFTVSRASYDKLRRAQDLLRHSVPNGDPAEIFDRALTLLVADLEKKKLGAAKRPRAAQPVPPGSRHIPASVKREVWARDGGQCAYVGATGRCEETGFLEFHHVVPFAEGGETSAANVELRCRAHNAYEAEQWFGPMFVRERRSVWTECSPLRVPLCGTVPAPAPR